jgi:hypothetical protein
MSKDAQNGKYVLWERIIRASSTEANDSFCGLQPCQFFGVCTLSLLLFKTRQEDYSYASSETLPGQPALRVESLRGSVSANTVIVIPRYLNPSSPSSLHSLCLHLFRYD